MTSETWTPPKPGEPNERWPVDPRVERIPVLPAGKEVQLIVSDGGSTQDLYGVPEGARDADDIISAKGMSFRVGNIFKACYRLGRKQGVDVAYDLRKIIFNAQRELERIEGRGL